MIHIFVAVFQTAPLGAVNKVQIAGLIAVIYDTKFNLIIIRGLGMFLL
jgi:hypothetical protein